MNGHIWQDYYLPFTSSPAFLKVGMKSSGLKNDSGQYLLPFRSGRQGRPSTLGGSYKLQVGKVGTYVPPRYDRIVQIKAKAQRALGPSGLRLGILLFQQTEFRQAARQ